LTIIKTLRGADNHVPVLTPSAKNLHALGEICNFLAQPEAREINQSLVKLAKALEDSEAKAGAS